MNRTHLILLRNVFRGILYKFCYGRGISYTKGDEVSSPAQMKYGC